MPLLAMESTSAEKQAGPVKPSLWSPEGKSPQRCHERDGRKRSFPALLGSLVTSLVPWQNAADTKMRSRGRGATCQRTRLPKDAWPWGSRWDADPHRDLADRFWGFAALDVAARSCELCPSRNQEGIYGWISAVRIAGSPTARELSWTDTRSHRKTH